MKNLVLVTGADGFIGKRLVQILVDQGRAVRKCTRTAGPGSDVAVGNIDEYTDWSSVVDGVDTVIHLAGRVHIEKDTAEFPLAEFRKINVDVTNSLARCSVESGVRRFIFLSSIGVNGRNSVQPFTESDQADPTSAYAVSKFEAEQKLHHFMQTADMQMVIIRPPLVYGPGVHGNFGRLVEILRRGYPLPLGTCANKRSYVALDNLVSLIVACIDHPGAANQIFLAGDGEDVSTTDLLRRLGKALGKPAVLFPFPTTLLKLSALLLGKKQLTDRLCGSLQTDISKSCRLLGWRPPLSLDEGLRSVNGNSARFREGEVSRI
jgi:nucleoside-diphosphate-sugar epimerase